MVNLIQDLRNPELAVQVCTRGLGKVQTSFELRQLRAEALEQQGLRSAAVREYSTLRRMHPSQPTPLLLRASCLGQMGPVHARRALSDLSAYFGTRSCATSSGCAASTPNHGTSRSASAHALCLRILALLLQCKHSVKYTLQLTPSV